MPRAGKSRMNHNQAETKSDVLINMFNKANKKFVNKARKNGEKK